MTSYKKISICYNPDDDIGRLIRQSKLTSSDIRDLLWIVKGAEYLRKTNAPSKQIEDHLFKALRYHAGQIAEIKALIGLEKQHFTMSSIAQNPSKVDQLKSKTKKDSMTELVEKLKL